MQRALWKGAISFGLVYIPVQLFSADDSHGLDLTMVDKHDFSPIGYKRINKHTGKEVGWDHIVKAYEYEDDRYVVLTEADLRRANAKATRTIDILSFVEATQIPPVYYEKPYYLAPGKGGEKVYALLREALLRSGKVAISQIVIRTKQHLAALAPMDDMIVLNTLRYGDELRSAEELHVPQGGLKESGISAKELDMALTLIAGMTEEWDAGRYRDTYREDLLALVKKKVKARQTKIITEADDDEDSSPPSAQVIDLMALLKQSVNRKGIKSAGKTPVRKTSGGKRPAAKKPAKTAARSKAG